MHCCAKWYVSCVCVSEKTCIQAPSRLICLVVTDRANNNMFRAQSKFVRREEFFRAIKQWGGKKIVDLRRTTRVLRMILQHVIIINTILALRIRNEDPVVFENT